MKCYRGFLGFCWGALGFLLCLGLYGFFFLFLLSFLLFLFLRPLVYCLCTRGTFIFYKISLTYKKKKKKKTFSLDNEEEEKGSLSCQRVGTTPTAHYQKM
jgi:hypothetical protein